MAINLYDEALVNKIKKWTKKTDIRVLKPDETTRLFSITADTNKDIPITLPLIALSRDKQIEILSTQKQPKTFDGFLYESNEKKSMSINVIPIKLNYQLDIYTLDMATADEFVRQFVFNFINHPQLSIEVPYNNIKILHESNVFIGNNVIDNSDIPEKKFPDQFYRFTIDLTIDDAYLFSIPIQDTVSIEGEEIVAKFSDENVSNV